VRRRPRVRVEAPQSGGGQERGMRSGTLPTPLCVGLGAACDLAMQEMEVLVLLFISPLEKKLIHRDRFVRASVCPSENPNLGYYFAISKYFFIKLSKDIAFDKTDTVIPNSLGQGYICWCFATFC